MAKLRKGVSYRRIDRPYTRRSKFRQKAYVRASPHSKIVRYNMGDLSRKFPYQVDLCVTESLQLRHNCLESARLTSNRTLEKALGKNGFQLLLRPYPHHILRENPLASGAGADRMSTGMAFAFGKPIGIAAQVREGQIVLSAYVEKQHLDVAKKALKKAQYKLPCTCKIIVSENKS